MAGHETIFVVTGSSEVLSSNQNADFLHLVDNDFAEDDGASEYGDSNFQSSGTPAPHFAESERVICITTHHIAKDVSNGFLFGRSADCDIRLGSVFVSERQFALKIDLTFKTILLKNHSQHGTPVRLHPSNESILLRGSRAFDHGHTVEILIGDEVRLGIRCLRAPASWNAYCAELRTMLPGLGPLNFAPNIQSTNASGRRPVYTCRRPLTEGSNSQVQEAIEKYNARLYAVKVYKRSAKARGQEPELLQMLQHPNIVGFVSYDRPGNKEPATLVMELVQGDTLEALLDSHNTNNRLSQSGVRGVLHQMVHALSYMHGQGITHRDLRPANVMVLARRTPICIKLIDFVQATTAHQFSDYTGRSLYTAPEIVAGQVCTDKVDLFSVGMMALQMIFGLPRAPRALPAEWLQAVFARACFLSIEYPFSVPVNFVCSLLREDPNSRPSALQALGDLFFVPGNNIETPVALIDADFADTPNNLHQEVLLPIDDNEVQQPPEQQQAPLPGHYNAVPENDNDGNAPDAAAEQPEQSSRPPTPITPHAPDAPRVFINGHEINTHGFPGHVNVQEICALVPPAQRRECLVLCARLRVREVIVVRDGISWVPLKEGCFLGVALQLNMRPLLDFAGLPSSVLDSNHLLLSAPLPSQFEVLWWRGVSIVYAPADGMVHVKQLFDFYGNYIHVRTHLSLHPEIRSTTATNRACRGKFISLRVAYQLCIHNRLDTSVIQELAERCGIDLRTGLMPPLNQDMPENAGSVTNGDLGNEPSSPQHQDEDDLEDNAEHDRENPLGDQTGSPPGKRPRQPATHISVENIVQQAPGNPFDSFLHWEDIPGCMDTPSIWGDYITTDARMPERGQQSRTPTPGPSNQTPRGFRQDTPRL